MNFKVGDRFVDIGIKRSMNHGIIVERREEDELYDVRFDSTSGNFSRFFDDHELIPEAIYYSPLYQALL